MSAPAPSGPRLGRPRLHLRATTSTNDRARALAAARRSARDARHRRGADGRARAPGPHVVGAAGPRPAVLARPARRGGGAVPAARRRRRRRGGVRARGADQVAQRRAARRAQGRGDPRRGAPAGGLGRPRDRRQRGRRPGRPAARAARDRGDARPRAGRRRALPGGPPRGPRRARWPCRRPRCSTPGGPATPCGATRSGGPAGGARRRAWTARGAWSSGCPGGGRTELDAGEVHLVPAAAADAEAGA